MTYLFSARCLPRLSRLGFLTCLLSPLTLGSGLADATAAGRANEPSAVEVITEGTAVTTGSRALSVAPQSGIGKVTYPPERPAWVDALPNLAEDVHRWPVVSTPASTAELSRKALDAQLRAAAETYIETLLGDADSPAAIALEPAWIESRVSVDRQYEGHVYAGDETMYESAAELLFEPADRQWIESRWKSHQVGHRLVGLALLTFLSGAILFVMTAGMSMVARRAEQRVTQRLRPPPPSDPSYTATG
jgi:hypothetical protein